MTAWEKRETELKAAAQEIDEAAEIEGSTESKQPEPITDQEFQEIAAHNAEIEEAIAPYSKGLDRNPDVLWAEAIGFVRRAQEDIFEAGRRFIVLKERAGHGNFIKELGNRGLDARRVWELMIITRKFANIRTLGYLSKSKLQVLSQASDEEIQQLERDGNIWSIPQDELAGMSYREIKAAYQKERDKGKRQSNQIEEGRKQLAEQEEKTRQLEAALKDAKTSKYPEDEEAQLARLLDIKRHFFIPFAMLKDFVHKLDKLPPHVRTEVVALYNHFARVAFDEMRECWGHPHLEGFDFNVYENNLDLPGGKGKIPDGNWDEKA